MNVIDTPKSDRINLIEGMSLTAIFQAVPTFAAAVLLLKLAGTSEIIGDPGGTVLFVALASLIWVLVVTYFGPKFPSFFEHRYEPLFFDAGLSLAEKILRWRTQPATSLRLLTLVTLLSLLALAVGSVR